LPASAAISEHLFLQPSVGHNETGITISFILQRDGQKVQAPAESSLLDKSRQTTKVTKSIQKIETKESTKVF
jgi:hypothetical protein